MLNPETDEDENDNVVVTDDADEKQLKHGEVLTHRAQGRAGGWRESQCHQKGALTPPTHRMKTQRVTWTVRLGKKVKRRTVTRMWTQASVSS